MPKTKNVRLKTPDAELEFAIQSNTTGKQLFDQVTKTVGLREVWFFGITFIDSDGMLDWIKLNRKVIGGHKLRKEDPIELNLKIKFYPEDADLELIQQVTKRYFFLELKQSFLSNETFCPAETCVLLASYACQVKYGDFNESIRFQSDRLLPARVLDQYELSPEKWFEKIKDWWKEHEDMLKEDAMTEYIKIAQDLEMYGVAYFDIKNKKGTDLVLGVDALGLNIYLKENKLTPKIGFPWSEIKSISFNDKKFIIKHSSSDNKAPDFIFFTTRLRINKRILSLCMGNHELYMRRRKEDSIEIQQMKAQAEEEMASKKAEKERQKSLKMEREAKQEENRKLKQEIEEIKQKQIAMEEDLLRKQQEKEESERRAWELELMKEKQDEEMRKLQERKTEIENEVEVQRVEFAIKSAEENERKNEHLLQVQREKEELEKKIVYTTMLHQRQKEELDLRERENELRFRGGGRMYPQYSVEEDVETVSVEMSHQANMANDRSEEDRRVYVGSKNTLTKQVKDLGADLEQYRKAGTATQNDLIHQDNVKQERTKYKTLKQIRQGNTRQRVEQFEQVDY